MKTKCLILRHPLTIPRVARILDDIVSTNEFDIIEAVRYLLNGIAENIIDDDKENPFEPLAYYNQTIGDDKDAFHMAVDEDYDPDNDAELIATVDFISVGLDRAHEIYFDLLQPSIQAYSFNPTNKYEYTVMSHLNEPIEESLDDEHILIQIKQKDTIWWPNDDGTAVIKMSNGNQLHITHRGKL